MRLAIRYSLLAVAVVIVTGNAAVYIWSLSTKGSSSSPSSSLSSIMFRGLDAGGGGDPGVDRLKTSLSATLSTLYTKRMRLYMNMKGNGTSKNGYRAEMDLMPLYLRRTATRLPVTMTAEEFRSLPSSALTGNPLLDTYGDNDPLLSGEGGRGVTFVDREKEAAAALQRQLNVNVMASDVIPLNRKVPDSRLDGCDKIQYTDLTGLGRASVIVPFYDEWPSVLLRTVYSVLNRTPRSLLQEVILVDDNSTMPELGGPLEQYIEDHFPRGLVRLLRMPKREGLIRCRMRGWKESRGDVVVFFDSHMEVNIDWLQPLLIEIKKDRKTVAMSVLDYINQETLEYRFNRGYLTRYGFDWRLIFFETFFRQDQVGPTAQSPRPGAMMVGAAFAMDRKYFEELGGYDMGMKVWGGENLEMAWRVWMCGGRMVTLPCSHLGHIARAQPYTFPEGRQQIEQFNYKRAIEVWMGEHKKFVYDYYPQMKALDVGNLSERIALRERLQCHNFTWYIHNIWPELTIYDENAIGWGSLMNKKSQKCLDNHSYLFQAPAELPSYPCHYHLDTQGFTLTNEGLLRTTLQCVVVKQEYIGGRPVLEDCVIGPRDKWTHTKDGSVVHVKTKMCLDEDPNGPIMRACTDSAESQKWAFTHYANSQ